MMEITDLTRTFERFQALKGVSLDVENGETLLVLGANGAGKTTLFRCILGLLSFDGAIQIDGLSVSSRGKELRERIGYVPQLVSFPIGLTVSQVIRLHCGLHGIQDLPWDGLFGRAGLTQIRDKKVTTLSGGMKQRLALALSVVHNPDLVIMDEPLANLDAKGREIFGGIIASLKGQGRTVLVSMHHIAEMVPLAQKVLVLDHGEKVYHSSLEDFMLVQGSTRMRIRVDAKRLEDLGDCRVIENRGEWVVLETSNVPKLLNEFASSGIDVGQAVVEETPLHEIIDRWKMSVDGK